MRDFIERDGLLRWRVGWASLACWILLTTATVNAGQPVIQKWGRFEQTFKSSVVYSNALQAATVKVVFTSPLGETNEVYGFWDGARTWRVRFRPDVAGQWTFRSSCSDLGNHGLQGQSGQFICTAAGRATRFSQHGPVRVALDRRHFEHADGTAFLWLADTVWDGARLSKPQDWEDYATIRAGQKFTVAQFAVAPGEDERGETAFSGNESIAINPAFFQRLDAKIATLSRAGILSAVAPWLDASPNTTAPPPEEQAILLGRYVVARWGAESVAWIKEVKESTDAERVKRIGRALFAGGAHAPVILSSSKGLSALNDLRKEEWVDGLAIQTVTDLTDEALKAACSGPVVEAWKKQPSKALISIAPPENAVTAQSGKRFEADEVRRAIYTSLLCMPLAGVTYQAQGVLGWDMNTDPGETAKTGSLPLWRRALFMPGAKQMSSLERFMGMVRPWELHPEPSFVVSQPGVSAPARFIASAANDTKDLSLVYVPEERTLEVAREALPVSPNITWFNPRTGENNPAVAVVGERSCQFPTADPGDWVLVMRAGK